VFPKASIYPNKMLLPILTDAETFSAILLTDLVHISAVTLGENQ
jgi:hypothetical protein